MRDVFVHPQALVESSTIGRGTRVWAFAHILPLAKLGEDCNICDHVFIENDVLIGDRVTVKSGVQIWDGIRLQNDVFVGPNATFTNDPFPRSKQYLEKHPKTLVCEGASIGANATILPGLTIGQHALIGAGSVVTRSVPPYAVVVGNPARIVRYVSSSRDARSLPNAQSLEVDPKIRIDQVQILLAPIVTDMRGSLAVREFGKTVPFTPMRSFVVFDVPSKEVRGEHAHRQCKQFLICLRGSVAILCDDGTDRQEFLLDNPEIGLYLPPMVWGVQYKYTHDALLLVLASHAYDPQDYIRDYAQFMIERSQIGERRASRAKSPR